MFEVTDEIAKGRTFVFEAGRRNKDGLLLSIDIIRVHACSHVHDHPLIPSEPCKPCRGALLVNR